MLKRNLKKLIGFLSGQKRSFSLKPRSIGKLAEKFLVFWLKVLLSPLFLWQVFTDYLKRDRSKKQSKHSQYLISPRRKKRQATVAGFVLPTVTMVLLVFSLVVSAILLRTSQQTQQVSATRETQVTYNTATPAIERAKSKIEFLFKRDPRFGNSVPGERRIEGMMLNVNVATPTDTSPLGYRDPNTGNYVDIYTLPGETRIDVNGDNVVDNAWAFRADIDGDGNQETIAYSIFMNEDRSTVVTPPAVPALLANLDSTDATKASNRVTRTGPMTIQAGGSTADCNLEQFRVEDGWKAINAATVRKNFQVNAVVVNRNNANRAVTSVEFQQDRQLDRGNKWGVWFRYDLEVFPGPVFNWNGAMHTDGNMLWGDTDNALGINAYLISSPSSCLYTQDASELTMTQVEDQNDNIVFQGQVVSGVMNRNNYNGRSEVDIFPGPGTAPSGSNLKVTLNSDNDSILNSLQTGSTSVYDFSLDPIALFTRDVSRSRNTTDPTNATLRDPAWNNSVLARRMLNKIIRRPYVDDTYRADNRWGPKPAYNDIIKVPNAASYGQPIDAFVDTLTVENSPVGLPEEVGLDGYWERRARIEGLRVIVGQRLEVGNRSGWVRNEDPLYPASSTTATNLQKQRRSLRDNLAAAQAALVYHYQARSTSDTTPLDFPKTILASTVHNGTTTVRDRSRNFTSLDGLSSPNNINADFLTGDGTNGWEFFYPTTFDTFSEFATEMDTATSPLRLALTNLSRFAGDPDGAFPAKQETNGFTNPATVTEANLVAAAAAGTQPIAHPYPTLTMWGDFSNLRRALNSITSTNTYEDLSIADRTTIQTAAATVGLLSYTLNNYKNLYNAAAADTGATSGGLEDLASQLWRLMDGDPANGEVNQLINPPVAFPVSPTDTVNYAAWRNGTGVYASPATPANTPVTTTLNAAAFYAQFTSDQYIEALNNTTTTSNTPITDATRRAELTRRARQISMYRQIERDRTLGFNVQNNPLPAVTPSSNNVVWGATTGTTNAGSAAATPPTNAVFRTACDPDEFDAAGPSGAGLTGTVQTDNKIALAVAFCRSQPTTTGINYLEPRFPSLYYIFPKNNHDQIGRNFNGSLTALATDLAFDNQVSNITNNSGLCRTVAEEEYARDCMIFNTETTTDMNHGFVYRVIADTDSNGTENGTENGIASIALVPRIQTAWILPNTTTDTGTQNSINALGTTRYLTFLDKAFYNGRQMLQERVIDVDLNLLRNNRVSTDTNSDTWMSASGVIYAFREDAIREDAIVRPRRSTSTFTTCDTEAELMTVACRMSTNPNTPQDPPISSETGVSTKPVDFYADPDRRSNGFRLKNGRNVDRFVPTGELTTLYPNNGFSFISDNPIYVQGNLNLHENSATPPARLEEFTQLLDINNYDNSGNTGFYRRTTLSTNFAVPTIDRWRTVEILGDAVTLLSNTFCDGTMEDGFRNQDNSCASGTSTYLNAPLANLNDPSPLPPTGPIDRTLWQRENNPNPAGTDSNDINFPIRVDRNGNVRRSNAAFTSYKGISAGRSRGNAEPTEMNAIFINGLVPSRRFQSYGGLHNFPRFLEDWSNDNLRIAGAFVQLNFSTSATAPFDLEGVDSAWEPGGNDPTDTESLPYYNPPIRRWGYDIALQYRSAGPIAARFVTVGSPRNEFFQQIPSDDPYSRQLRCSTLSGQRIDPNATDCP